MDDEYLRRRDVAALARQIRAERERTRALRRARAGWRARAHEVLCMARGRSAAQAALRAQSRRIRAHVLEAYGKSVDATEQGLGAFIEGMREKRAAALALLREKSELEKNEERARKMVAEISKKRDAVRAFVNITFDGA